MASILVVDDEFGILEAIEALLIDAGHLVQRALHGQQALAIVAEHAIDAIVLDLMMPVMDGPTFLKGLRQHPQFRQIPVVIMTGLAKPAVAAIGLADHQGLLTKPFRAQELYDAVDGALATRASSRRDSTPPPRAD